MALSYCKKRARPLRPGATAAAQMVAMGGLRRSDHGILPIFCWQTVAFCFLCGRLLGLSLANLRKEKYIANSPEPRFEDSS